MLHLRLGGSVTLPLEMGIRTDFLLEEFEKATLALAITPFEFREQLSFETSYDSGATFKESGGIYHYAFGLGPSLSKSFENGIRTDLSYQYLMVTTSSPSGHLGYHRIANDYTFSFGPFFAGAGLNVLFNFGKTIENHGWMIEKYKSDLGWSAQLLAGADMKLKSWQSAAILSCLYPVCALFFLLSELPAIGA